MWGTEAEEFRGDGEAVIVVKGAIINEFRGTKSVSAQNSSTILINPDIPEVHQLRGWYDNEGKAMDYKNTAQRCVGLDDGKDSRKVAFVFFKERKFILFFMQESVFLWWI